MLKESQKQARVRILADGLAFLLSTREPSVRSQIFIPQDKYKSAERQEAFKKDWQRDALKRLVDAGLLEETKIKHQLGYKVYDAKKISSILTDYKTGDGSLLVDFLWPKKSIVLSSKPEQEAIEPVASEEELPDTMIILGQINETMSQMVDILSKNQTVFLAKLEEYSESNAELQEKLRLAIYEISGKLGANNGEIIKKLGGSNKRIDELEEKIGTLTRVIEANQSTMKSTLKATENISQASAGMLQAASAMKDSEERTRALQQALEEFTGKLEDSEKDKTGRLIKAIENHVQEGEHLKNMVLEHISE